MTQSLTNPIGRVNDGRVEVNDAPVRVRWAFDDLVTSDGHRLTATFACSLRALAEPAERKLFEETFLARSPAASLDDVVNHFAPALRSAAAALANRETAEAALSDTFRPQWLDAIRTAGNAVAFSCGVELLAPFSVDITSPSLQQERLEQMQRTVAERKAADRVEHFQRAAHLLKQWDALKASAPSITPGQLLEQLNPADRGAMLETLIRASAQQGAQPDLWAVAGPSLVRIDLKGSSPQSTLIALPTTAGPLRSVSVMDGRVLVGARNGVFVVDPARPEQPETYLDPDLQSEYGFTRVTFGPGNTIFACHRDGGIVGWTIGQYDRPVQQRRTAELSGSPKNLLLIRGQQELLFTVEQQLMRWTNGEPTTVLSTNGPILSLLDAGDELIAVGEDGFCSLIDPGTLQVRSTFRPAQRVSSAGLLPWLTSHRLLLAQPDGAIAGVGVDDQLMTAYTAAYLGFRDVTASAGKVAAMSADRQRIVLWNAWDGRKPAGEIYLTSLTRHRIADISFAS